MEKNDYMKKAIKQNLIDDFNPNYSDTQLHNRPSYIQMNTLRESIWTSLVSFVNLQIEKGITSHLAQDTICSTSPMFSGDR